MNYLQLDKVNNIEWESLIEKLPKQGTVHVKNNNYCYLNIDDRYIHNAFDFLPAIELKKPDYFDETTQFMGAHISIIYPEENVTVFSDEIGKIVDFEVDGLFSARLLNKTYYVFKVISPHLLELRKRYGLNEKLLLKGHLVDFHITVGVKCDKENSYYN